MAILYEIEFNSKHGIIDIHQLSAYSEEQEVLLQDGLEYEVLQVRKVSTENNQQSVMSFQKAFSEASEYFHVNLRLVPELQR